MATLTFAAALNAALADEMAALIDAAILHDR